MAEADDAAGSRPRSSTEGDLRSRVTTLFVQFLGAEADVRVDEVVAGVLAALDSTVAERARPAEPSEVDPRVTLDEELLAHEHAEPLLERLRRQSLGRDRYRELREHARGGMGVILEVWDLDLRRKLAMKVAHDESPARLARFLGEAQVTGQLDHPGIVPVHELGTDEDGHVYFTMRLLRGDDLRTVLHEKRSQWTREALLGVVLRTCETVGYAHSRGVVHRDLKPANVMVGSFGEVYVVDWGVAKVLGRDDESDVAPSAPAADGAGDVDTSGELLTADGTVIGTASYMPPEQARGESSDLDRRADVYAAGAMLYEVLAGRPPYTRPGRAESAPIVLMRVLEGPPERLDPALPAELVAICEKAMARERDDRYADMSELAADLRAFLEGRVVRAWRTGPWIEARKWVRRNPGWATAAAVLVAVLTLGPLWRARVSAEQQRELLLASDPYLLTSLRADSDRLWPAHPERIEQLEDFLGRSDALLARRSEHEARLARGDLGVSESERARGLLAGLDGFTADGGLLDDVRERLATARAVEAETVSGPAAAARWADARSSIAGLEVYAGLDLPPQLGLVPVGCDPSSGLWEFALWESGEVPERNDAGLLVIRDGSAIVLVLVPGGGEHALAPFFVSKLEVTIGQWRRLTGSEPAYDPTPHNPMNTDVHPLQNASWDDCARVLPRFLLDLPTGAQWEHAARASADEGWDWYPGAELESLRGHANLADRSLTRIEDWADAHAAEFPDLDDGSPFHAPVGSYAANRFGLHDVHGNVMEFCLEPEDAYARAAGGPQGLRYASSRDELLADRTDRVARGGAWNRGPSRAALSFRSPVHPEQRQPNAGVRPVRRVLP